MMVYDLFDEKYLLFRVSNKGLEFWKESAVGYTTHLLEAGVYTEEQVGSLGLRVFSINDVKKGSHLKYSHFAMKMREAIIGLR